jgi:hypothetical protein
MINSSLPTNRQSNCTCGLKVCIHPHNFVGNRHFVNDCQFNRDHYPELIGQEHYGDGPFTLCEFLDPCDEAFFQKHPHFKTIDN